MISLEDLILNELEDTPKINSTSLKTYTLNIAMAERLSKIMERSEVVETTLFKKIESLENSGLLETPTSYLDTVNESAEILEHANRMITNVLFLNND